MTSSPTSSREFDIVLFGATGFVGKLTAEHYARHAPADARIALAGRSQARLDAVRDALPGRGREFDVIVADAGDLEQMRGLAGRTQVVVTTVGPYARFGLPLVQACAESGTHYADLTGEVLFAQRSLAGWEESAKASGARIVHACGFDSVPSDLGVMVTAEAARADGAGDLTTTTLAVRSMRGGISGGTIDSARGQVDEALGSATVRKQLADPYVLTGGWRPERRPSSPAKPSGVGGVLAGVAKRLPVRRDSDTGRFSAPFVMAQFNTRIVNRSAALLGYGPHFRYAEYTDCGTGATGAAMATGLAAGLTAGLAGLAFKPTRKVLDRVLPKPGDGPSAKSQAQGRFLMQIDAETSSGAHFRTRFGAHYDPGYGGTAIMLGQAGLALAFDGPEQGRPEAAGVLTPATALGDALVARLRTFDFQIETTRQD